MAGGCLRRRGRTPHRGGTRHQEGSQAQRLDRTGQCAAARAEIRGRAHQLMAVEHERDGESAAAIVSWRPRLEGMCTSMRIGLFASNAAPAEYFVIALGMADHTVTLY